jgi:hypothetical protein
MIRPPLLSLAPLLDLVAVMAPLRDPVAVLPAAAAQDAHGPINSYWLSQGLAHRYHTYAAIFRSTTSALTKSFLTPTSITSVTPTPDLPSCPLLASSSLSLPPTPMSRPKSFCFYVLSLGAYSHFRSEGSLSGGLLFRLCSFSLCLCLEG